MTNFAERLSNNGYDRLLLALQAVRDGRKPHLEGIEDELEANDAELARRQRFAVEARAFFLQLKSGRLTFAEAQKLCDFDAIPSTVRSAELATEMAK